MLWIRAELVKEKFWRPLQDVIGDSFHLPAVLLSYQVKMRLLLNI